MLNIKVHSIKEHFGNNDPQGMWKGIQRVTDYRPDGKNTSPVQMTPLYQTHWMSSTYNLKQLTPGRWSSLETHNAVYWLQLSIQHKQTQTLVRHTEANWKTVSPWSKHINVQPDTCLPKQQTTGYQNQHMDLLTHHTEHRCITRLYTESTVIHPADKCFHCKIPKQ